MKRMKKLTRNKLFTRVPVLLAEIKAGNNSCKLKNEIRPILYFLYQHNKITKEVYNNFMSLYNHGREYKNERKHDCD